MYTVPRQTGRTVVVTGASSGTGREAAVRLAGAGARVVLAVRDQGRGDAALAALHATHPRAQAEVRIVDLADLTSVRAFADGLHRDLDHLDTLVNNAGVMAVPTRHETVDGHELQWGTNFLGPLALTNLLLPLLLASPAPRVATMSSGTANWGRIDLADPDRTRRYSASGAYAASKLADLYLARHLAHVSDRRGWGLVSTAAHPGFTRTNLQSAGPNLGRAKPRWSPLQGMRILPSMLPPEGAGPILFAAADPAAANGAYYGPTGRFTLVGEPGPARLNRRMRDDAAAARVWAAAEQITGTALPLA
ncbi:SDR family oxidoreductase [Xylanimonas protaetiae]|uniref:SDR family NAD(P)-dependent oxidoreductase n=1 Tax=Xylanimonas protaetiae TaxID=2509457 RepID=A0A4P6F561_9MICO|nr:SDR family oxidoreductase [Xylanimonas protaetiae]QAY70832.1 SDR family NAD(P)-dependent oxidoreductase [Xylanimonas protaetiae]